MGQYKVEEEGACHIYSVNCCTSPLSSNSAVFPYLHKACHQPQHAVEVVAEYDERRHVDERVGHAHHAAVRDEQEVHAGNERTRQQCSRASERAQKRGRLHTVDLHGNDGERRRQQRHGALKQTHPLYDTTGQRHYI